MTDTAILPLWFTLTLLSAFLLGIYDIFKKHAVSGNAVTPVLWLSTTASLVTALLITLARGQTAVALACTPAEAAFIFGKALIVGSSWVCVYNAMRELPISIASPVRASSPLWTLFGGILLFHEIPNLLQAVGMALIFFGYYGFSVVGKLEGITLRSKSVLLVLAGTLLGAGSALYDKLLLNAYHLPPERVQFYFLFFLSLLLGAAVAGRHFRHRPHSHLFTFRWSILITGALLALADYTYFQAVSGPGIQISVISLIRRSSVLVTFGAGSWFFHDKNIFRKAGALLFILIGILLLAAAKH